MLLFGVRGRRLATMPALRQILPSTPQGWAVTALGALGAAASVWALWPTSPRLRVAQHALSQVGAGDASVYWADVLPGYPQASYPKDWCGAFALWALHQAGLGENIFWVIGVGFLSENLPTTTTPQVGDIAYFNTNEHHAVVVGVNPDQGTVDLINGNGTGGLVSTSTTPVSHVAGFYSIEPLLASAQGDSSLGYLAASAIVLGAGAWVLLPGKDDSR